MKTHQIITAKLQNVARLEKLRKDVDPASGMSIMVRRGPLCQESSDEEARVWIAIETGDEDTVLKVLNAMIDAELSSVNRLRIMAIAEKSATEAAIVTAEHELKLRGRRS